MSFLFSAGLALLLEIAGPLAAIVLVAWRLKPRAAAGVRGAGLAAVPLGALLFLAAVFVQQAIAVVVPDSIADPAPGWRPLLVHGTVAGGIAGLVEETIRFTVAFALFRRAAGRPLVAAALFGLGWGAVECALVAANHIPELAVRVHLYGSASAVPLPFAPLLVTLERLGAMLLHVAMAAFAAAAAMSLARRAFGRAAALFVAAVVVHALLDAWIRVMFVRFPVQAGITGPLIAIAVFASGGAMALWVAARMRRADPLRAGPPLSRAAAS